MIQTSYFFLFFSFLCFIPLVRIFCHFFFFSVFSFSFYVLFLFWLFLLSFLFFAFLFSFPFLFFFFSRAFVFSAFSFPFFLLPFSRCFHSRLTQNNNAGGLARWQHWRRLGMNRDRESRYRLVSHLGQPRSRSDSVTVSIDLLLYLFDKAPLLPPFSHGDFAIWRWPPRIRDSDS